MDRFRKFNIAKLAEFGPDYVPAQFLNWLDDLCRLEPGMDGNSEESARFWWLRDLMGINDWPDVKSMFESGDIKCLLDLVYLWLTYEDTAVERCGSFEEYLINVIRIIEYYRLGYHTFGFARGKNPRVKLPTLQLDSKDRPVFNIFNWGSGEPVSMPLDDAFGEMMKDLEWNEDKNSRNGFGYQLDPTNTSEDFDHPALRRDVFEKRQRELQLQNK